MTKKLLALALAGTTAFSVFGGLNVFAAYSWDTAEAYGDKFTNETAAVSPTLTGGALAFSDLDKISFEDVTADAFEYDGDTYYVADWSVKDATKTDAFEEAVAAAKTAGSDDYDTTHKALVTAALAAAYNLSGGTAVTLKASTDKDSGLISAYSTLVANYNAIDDYLVGGSTNAEKIAEDYDVADFDAYQAEDLFDAIVTSYGKTAFTDTLSYMTYLNNEYTRIMGMVEGADISDKIDLYEHYLEATSALTESDYSATNWSKIEYNLRLAEINANAGKYSDAIANLKTALDTTPEKGDYADLQATLMSMYADSKGATRASYIIKNYTTSDYAIYDASDYKVSTTKQTDEWNALFVDKIWYYNPLDAVAADDAESNLTYSGIYGYAYELYTQARKGKVAQSRLDTANEMLTLALEDLDPTTSSTAWAMVKLEKTVELAESLADTDFNANSTKWKTFVANLEKAEAVLAKSNPSKSEVTNVTNNLNNSMIALKDVKKNPSYTLKKEFKEILKEAKDALKELDDQNAAQYKALMNAIENAENLGSWLDVNEATGNFVELVSDYEEAVAELESAIAGYNQPQGWYTNADGKWMYGEGDSYVTSGWKKIKNAWYYFNADGTAKQNEWFYDNGSWFWMTNSCNAAHGWYKINGEWYFFRDGGYMVTGWRQVNGLWYYMDASGKMMTGWVNVGGKSYYLSKEAATYGAMLANTTTPDGYKVGADGAWIK